MKEKRPLGLTLIAIGKLFKVVTLVITGIVVLVMMHDPPKVLGSIADAMRIDPGNRHLHKLVAAASGASTTKLEAIGLGTFAYAALFAVEGIGLWLQKHWAEWLTIFITASFIPLEIIEIAKHAGALRIATLVFNVAALVYLVVRVFKRRASRGRGAHARGAEALHA
ncbi:MAG TPA: DUF2127 domain-containing protein [Labilithrix sp.]